LLRPVTTTAFKFPNVKSTGKIINDPPTLPTLSPYNRHRSHQVQLTFALVDAPRSVHIATTTAAFIFSRTSHKVDRSHYEHDVDDAKQ
jgi:hypothetical protein